MSFRHFTVLAIISCMAFPLSVIGIYSILDIHIPHNGTVAKGRGVLIRGDSIEHVSSDALSHKSLNQTRH